jgi:class 3 adenylate cyclase
VRDPAGADLWQLRKRSVVHSQVLPQCGSPLKPVGDDPRFASPTSYTPQHLADKILAARATLEGERKQVTVLFADIKGSMELFADRDAEAAQKIFDPVLERMIEAVHHYEGTVNRVMGDGIMALFGAPSPMRIMPCAHAMRRSGCSRPSSNTRTTFNALKGWE